MEKFKPLLGQSSFDRSKFIGPETLEAQTERKEKRLEYHQQVAEVFLEEGEEIFWHSGNLELDNSELTKFYGELLERMEAFLEEHKKQIKES